MDSSFISKYCKIRLVTGSVISGIIGVVLLLVSLFASRIVGDTSSYILADATVVDGDIKAYTSSSGRRSTTTYFNVIYNVEYTVDYMKYKGKVSERFTSFSQAKAVLDAAKGAIKKIYYDPLAHDKNSESRLWYPAFSSCLRASQKSRHHLSSSGSLLFRIFRRIGMKDDRSGP